MARVWIAALAALACNGGAGDGKGDDDDDDGCVDEIPYDDIDQDCDGEDWIDVDGDGADAEVAGGDDCDDDDADIFPGADEVPYDGIDQDCDGADLLDADGDGVDGMDAGGTDCNDADDTVFPGAADSVGDGVDQDCDGVDGVDADADGSPSFASGGDDCDDADDTIFPGATEVWYDGVDQDCDRGCDYDQDGDGFTLLGYEPNDNGGCDDNPQPGRIDWEEDCEDTDAAATDNFLQSTDPADLEAGVFNLAPIVARLSADEPTATLTVTDSTGTPIAGTTAWQGSDLVFTPTSALPALQTLDAELTWSCGVEAWSFTTSDFGTPTDPTTLAGRTYAIDLAAGDWVEPAGVGDLLATQLDGELLVGVVAATATTLDLINATGDGVGQQDLCFATGLFPTASFVNNPQFSATGVDHTFDLGGLPTTFEDITLSGTFSGSGDAVADGTLLGVIDTRPLIDLIAPGGPDSAVCDLVATFGVTCSLCPDGTGTYCLDIQVEEIEGIELPGVTLVPRDDAAIAADPTCP